MFEAAGLGYSYVAGMSKPEFLADRRTQQAVILNLMLIGEIATTLLKDHPEFVNAHSEIPWRDMKGMRNRIAHSYYQIDLDVVWDTVRTALPNLLVSLSRLRAAGSSPM